MKLIKVAGGEYKMKNVFIILLIVLILCSCNGDVFPITGKILNKEKMQQVHPDNLMASYLKYKVTVLTDEGSLVGLYVSKRVYAGVAVGQTCTIKSKQEFECE